MRTPTSETRATLKPWAQLQAHLRPASVGGRGFTPTKGALFIPAAEESFYSAVAEVAESAEEYAALLETFPQFVDASIEHVKTGHRGRFLISAAVESKPGVLHRVAHQLNDVAQCTIETIRSINVAGLSLILAIASDARQEPNLDAAVLEKHLTSPATDWGLQRDLLHVGTLLPGPEPEPGRSPLRLDARLPDQPGNLRAITSVLARSDGWLTHLSAWVDRDQGDLGCRVVLGTLLAQGMVDPVIEELRTLLADRGELNPKIDPGQAMAMPCRGPLAASRPGHRRVGISVIGRARSGYVHHVLSGLAPEVNVLGTSMALLAGQYTGLLLVVDLHEATDDATLRDELQGHVAQWDRDHGEWVDSDVRVRVVESASEAGPQEPTEIVTVRATDAPGLVARATSVPASLEANVVRLDGQADGTEDFAIRMIVARPDTVSVATMKEGFEQQGWLMLSIEPFQWETP